jgi:hypothetical protein
VTEEERYKNAWKRQKMWSRLECALTLFGFVAVFIPLLVFPGRKNLPTPN